MRAFIIVPIVMLGLGIGGACSTKADANSAASAETSPARPSEPDSYPTACSLIDQEAMSRILGGPVGPPAPDERGGSTTCTYTPAAGKGIVPYAQVKIDWHAGEAAMTGMNLAGRIMSKDAGFSVVDKIEGVGDEASMMIGGVMNVRQGGTFITIDLRMQPRAKDKGIAIAKAILARTGAVAPAK